MIQILAGFAAFAVLGQGTFVYDQQSATNDTGGVGTLGTNFHTNDSVGESFTPTLSSIGFFRLSLADLGGVGGNGAVLYVNLWTNAIDTGSLIATTAPVFIPKGFSGYTNFLFSTLPAVVSNTTYFFQPVLQPGSDVLDLGLTFGPAYPGGTVFFNDAPNSGLDLWFREGIEVVPEPSIISLILLGVAGIHFSRRKN